MEIIILVFLVFLALVVLAAIWSAQRKTLKVLTNLRIPEPQKIEFPKIEIPSAKEVILDLNPVVEAVKNIPKIEIPPANEVNLDLKPVIDAIKGIDISLLGESTQKIVQEIKGLKELAVQDKPKEIITADLLQNLTNTQNNLINALQETSTLMRVNQAEFQSGLEAFHKAIDKLLAQIPSSEKEQDIQKEFMQKFEEAFVKVQESAAETMNGNSLRLQEILTEFLNKEANRQ